jgi:hypothetical protein
MTGPDDQVAAAPSLPPERPRLIIEWAGPDSATLSIRPEGQVSIAQVYGAAWLLDAWARELRAQQVVGDLTRQIITATPGAIPTLGRLPGS